MLILQLGLSLKTDKAECIWFWSNFSKTNAFTKADCFPMARMEDEGASKLDLAKADFVKETVAYLPRVVCQVINLYTYYTY